MVKFLTGLAALFGGLLALLLPYFKKENERLNSENKQKDKVINSVKNAEEIKSKNSKLSKSELINKLQD